MTSIKKDMTRACCAAVASPFNARNLTQRRFSARQASPHVSVMSTRFPVKELTRSRTYTAN